MSLENNNKIRLKKLSDNWVLASERLKSKNFFLRDYRSYNSKSTRNIGPSYKISQTSTKEMADIFLDFNILIYLFPFFLRETVGCLNYCSYPLHNEYYLSKLKYFEKKPPSCLIKKMKNDYIYPTPNNCKTYTISLRVGDNTRVLTHILPFNISSLLKGYIIWGKIYNKDYLFPFDISIDYLMSNIPKYTDGLTLRKVVFFLEDLKNTDSQISYKPSKCVAIQDIQSSSEED